MSSVTEEVISWSFELSTILFDEKHRWLLPKHSFPSNPSLQMQVPVESSQVPWLAHVPSGPTEGQSNSIEVKYKEKNIRYLICMCILTYFSLLEQSMPCRPLSHEHCPVDVSQFPALLQSCGQVNSRINNWNWDAKK